MQTTIYNIYSKPIQNQLWCFHYYQSAGMKEITFYHLSITGLLLAAVSSIIMAVPAKRDAKIGNNEELILSDDGQDLTCKADINAHNCTYTLTQPDNCYHPWIGSRTSTLPENGTSSITLASCENKVKNISSKADNQIDEVTFNIPTSVDLDNT